MRARRRRAPPSGASRWRLARLSLVEGMLSGLLGIGGALLLGVWLSAVIEARLPSLPTGARNMALVPMLFEWRAIGFAVALGLVVTLVSSWWPAWRTLRRPLVWTNRAQAGVDATVPARLSRSILASQLAVATMVMMGTLFIGFGIWRYLHQPLGFDYSDRYRVTIALPESRSAGPAELDAALNAVREMPGILSAGPYELAAISEVEVPGLSLDPASVSASTVSPGYFETWNLRLLRGRWFELSEFGEDMPLAVVDQKLARLAWPDADPLGQEVRVGDGVLRRVVGVVAHRRMRLDLETSAKVYVPSAQPASGRQLVVWADGAAVAELQGRVAAAVLQVIPGAGVRVEPVTFETLFLRDIGEAAFQAPILLAFGFLAFALAGIGVFGLVSWLVERRTREFGIRLALGARPRDIWRNVVGQTLGPALFGVVAGLAGARLLESAVRSTVFGWESSGTAAAVVVAILVLGLAVAAAAVPARRAMRIDPAATLRME